MRIRFRVNLGSRDAAGLGLEFRECGEGSEADVPAKAAEWLINHGYAVSLAGGEPPAAEAPAGAQGDEGRPDKRGKK
jgi:hypothetical protein